MCSRTSFRFFAAATINSKRSRTFIWPVNSLNAGGRNETSNAGSVSGGFIESLQIFREHKLGAAALQNVVDSIERVSNQVQTETARFDSFGGSAAHLTFGRLLAVIAQAHANTFSHPLYR